MTAVECVIEPKLERAASALGGMELTDPRARQERSVAVSPRGHERRVERVERADRDDDDRRAASELA